MKERFTGSFTQQSALPEAALEAAQTVLMHGRLHRYNTLPGEVAEVVQLEAEFAAFTGARYCLAVASGGQAMALALRALGAKPGTPVLSNAFTLAPVPGAIAAAGAQPVLVESTEDLTIDLNHLEERIAETGARLLLLSHMRGHICDMDQLMELCRSAGVRVIEDCAHTMGASWNGIPSGRHGAVGCYSTQTYKHMNSGEGGLIVTDDDDLAARMILMSGSYMLFDRHAAAPGAEAFEGLTDEMPNMSARMDNLRAAILRPQLAALEKSCATWTERYRALEAGLAHVPGVTLIPRNPREDFVGSSFQFRLVGWPPVAIERVVQGCSARGVDLKWFGSPRPHGFTSRYAHWAYAAPDPLPATDHILAGLLDMRLPLTFTNEDCALIAQIIADEVSVAMEAWQAAE